VLRDVTERHRAANRIRVLCLAHGPIGIGQLPRAYRAEHRSIAKVDPSPDEAPATPAEPTGDDTVDEIDEGVAEPEPSLLPEALPVPESLPPEPADDPAPPV